ncbi:MAG: hypothetical protein IIC00_04180 [Planctomycetes bacterium]|nr:hypothetical protein [Planctomycetota bacterium]
MYCPKCGKENPDDARVCQFCNASITDTSEPKQPVTVRTSKLAIASFVCTLCGLLCFLPVIIAAIEYRILSPKSDLVMAASGLSLIAMGAAIILGVTALALIGSSGGRLTGYGFAAIGTAVPAILLIVICIPLTLRRPRSTAFRMVCGTNLSRIGKAMFIYSNDYDDEFPRAGGRNSIWSNHIPNWQADNPFVAYGLNADGTGGRVTITSSFYLLVKYAELKPKYLICNKEKGITEFNPADYGAGEKNLIDLWDFGPEPRKHCSYSYHMPYGPYSLTISSEPGLAVAAEPSPWMIAPAANPKNIADFDPDGDREKIKAGNAIAHQGVGQNVLFMDSHVVFEKVSFCGINDDNIYTYWDGPDIRRGAIPNLKSQPAGRLDSMLVNDLP